MKKLNLLIGIILVAVMLESCKKDNANPNPGQPVNSGYFFANTDWTGVAGTYGQTYPQPCYLHFNGDTTVSVYVLFSMYKGNELISMDSMVGKITAIDTVSDGRTSISVDFPLTNDQQMYYITDKKTLQGTASSTSQAPANMQFSTSAGLCPTVVPSVSGTVWNTDIMHGGPTEGMYEFPDISFLTFGSDGNTSYTRNGKIITYTPPDQDQLVLYHFNQTGFRLYFAGYNETTDKLIVYYGVLSADGNTILADTRARQDARLPYYYQTIFWYGPAGVTPNTHKVN
jgi:hypothetical protein